MAPPTDSNLRAIDVGMLGFSGHHDRMLQNVVVYAPQATLAVGVWSWIATLPVDLEFYRLSQDVTVALLLKLALGIWTAKVGWHLVVAAWFGVLWLGLEIRGVQWVRRNDHNFRVTYFRPKDRSIKYDEATRATRLDDELKVADWRRKSFATQGATLALYAVVYAIIPSAYVFSYELMNSEVHAFLDRWHFAFYAQLVWFYGYVIPVVVTFGTVIFEWFAYTSGAQYIPGAKLRDPVIPDKTLETMRAEMSHGVAPLVDPEQASRQLGSTK